MRGDGGKRLVHSGVVISQAAYVFCYIEALRNLVRKVFDGRVHLRRQAFELLCRKDEKHRVSW